MDQVTRDVLDQCLQALRSAVAGVGPGDGTLPTPCALWNVTQVIQHAAGDQLAWASIVGGLPMPDFDPFQPSGLLDAPLVLTDQALQAAATAWRGVKGNEPVPTPLPQGAMSPELAGRACALDAGVHAWDLAVATGRPSPLTAELGRELTVAAVAIVEPLRAYGAYAAALPQRDGDDADAALLRLLGRDPNWTAGH